MRVLILGCGYVGLELGRQLGAAGQDPVGVRRSPAGIEAIEDAGFEAVRADVTDPAELARVPDGDALVYAASTGGRGAEAARETYVDGLQTVVEHFAGRSDPPERLVYTSSTGVYGDHRGDWVDEATPLDPTTEKTRVLVEAERIAREETRDRGIQGVVARFAGLYGPDRYRLERYLEGPVTEGYLNMVHRDDAAGAVRFLLTHPALLDSVEEGGVGERGEAGEMCEKGERGEAGEVCEKGERGETGNGARRDAVVLVVDDEPVDKWEFADWIADECGVDRPPKRTKAERLDAGDLSEVARRRILTSKRCSNDRLRELAYEFEYPTYRAGYRAAIQAYRRSE